MARGYGVALIIGAVDGGRTRVATVVIYVAATVMMR